VPSYGSRYHQAITLSLLQVTRRWLNWHGDAVVEHLADQVRALEAALQT
jgi:hypothetical protein